MHFAAHAHALNGHHLLGGAVPAPASSSLPSTVVPSYRLPRLDVFLVVALSFLGEGWGVPGDQQCPSLPIVAGAHREKEKERKKKKRGKGQKRERG